MDGFLQKKLTWFSKCWFQIGISCRWEVVGPKNGVQYDPLQYGSKNGISQQSFGKSNAIAKDNSALHSLQLTLTTP